MTNYRNIVDRIQELLYRVTPAEVALLDALAEEYKTACHEVNTRLRWCGKLLQQGLRSEAIHQCDIEPPLLEIAAVLDFPELLQWRKRLAVAGIEDPPGLLIDTATELNEAYVEEQKLKPSLRNHRLLALGRAPLAARLQVVAHLQSCDRNNLIWERDRRAYERARFAELANSLRDAQRDASLEEATRLRDEVIGRGWLESVPAPLTQQAETIYRQLLRKAWLETVPRLAEHLRNASRANDLASARVLRQKWQLAEQQLGPHLSADLRAHAAPALEWLAAVDRAEELTASHEAAIAQVETAMQNGHNSREFDRVYKQLSEHEYGVPDELEERCQAHSKRLKRLEAVRKLRPW